MHCKDTLDGAPDRPNQVLIIQEIKALLDPKELGVEIVAARQGMRVRELFASPPSSESKLTWWSHCDVDVI